ncbi:hypothetical protein KR018_006866 [Drosophila ironensis]|nr:hypothetical protein KR018_006866 [Drosophila ironensis]
MRGVLPVAVVLILLRHLTGAAAVDKDVAPVGDVKTDLPPLEQEIGGSTAGDVGQRKQLPPIHRRRTRGLFFSGSITGFPWYAWPFSGYNNNFYGPPPYGYGYGNGNGYGLGYGYGGFYPGYLGYQKIIIG